MKDRATSTRDSAGQAGGAGTTARIARALTALILLAEAGCTAAPAAAPNAAADPRQYVRGHDFVLARERPSATTRIITLIPRGTALTCTATNVRERLLQTDGVWQHCPEAGGFIFGPLLGPQESSGEGLTLHLATRERDRTGIRAEARLVIHLKFGQLEGEHWERNVDKVQKQRIEGRYFFRSGQLVIRLEQRETVLYWSAWPPPLGAFAKTPDLTQTKRLLEELTSDRHGFGFEKEACRITLPSRPSEMILCVRAKGKREP